MNLINCTKSHNITNIETNYLIKFHDNWLKINILDLQNMFIPTISAVADTWLL